MKQSVTSNLNLNLFTKVTSVYKCIMPISQCVHIYIVVNYTSYKSIFDGFQNIQFIIMTNYIVPTYNLDLEEYLNHPIFESIRYFISSVLNLKCMVTFGKQSRKSKVKRKIIYFIN